MELWIMLEDEATCVMRVPGGMVVNTRSSSRNGETLTESNVTVYCDDDALLDQWIEDRKYKE